MMSLWSREHRSSRDPVESSSWPELFNWLSEHTEWAEDFDPDTQATTILHIHKAEKIPGQKWKITTKRRRDSSGIKRVEAIFIMNVDRFPSLALLEQLMQQEGYGGGMFSVSNTRGDKRTHRIFIEAEPEDPMASPPQPQPPSEKPDLKDELRSLVETAALDFLKQNSDYLRIVAIKFVEKEYGIKIPMPELPDPNAPLPYADLPDEMQLWLDENPEEKNVYIRRELGLDDPVEKEDVMTRILAEVEDQFVDDFTADLLKRPSGFGSAVGQMFEGTTIPEVIAKIGELYPGLFEKAATLTAKAEPGKSDASF